MTIIEVSWTRPTDGRRRSKLFRRPTAAVDFARRVHRDRGVLPEVKRWTAGPGEVVLWTP